MVTIYDSLSIIISPKSSMPIGFLLRSKRLAIEEIFFNKILGLTGLLM